MLNDTAKRCRHCGGTLWKDGDVVKCFMCSRAVGEQSASERALANFSNPKLPGSRGKYSYTRLK